MRPSLVTAASQSLSGSASGTGASTLAPGRAG